MANRCYNELEITGDKESLQSLVDYVKSEERVFDFLRIFPYPEDRVSGDSADEDNGETEWRIGHWGTKWNATDSSLKWVNEEKIIFEFDTAWGPSIPVTLSLSGKYPDLQFTHRYSVSRMDSTGIVTIRNGECVDHSKWELDNNPDSDDNS